MSDISKLTDHEKSVILTRLCGRYVQGKGLYEVLWYFDNGYFPIREPNIYDPAHMGLAWLVLNWGVKSSSIGGSIDVWWINVLQVHQLRYSPAEAQRLWLDKVLELAIEAGMVTPNEETK